MGETKNNIWKVLEKQNNNLIPFVPYDNLVPRGYFVRKLRNRGMSLCLRRNVYGKFMTNTSIENKYKDNKRITKYHTPEGTIREVFETDKGRISTGGNVQTEWMIEDIKDYKKVIAMLDETKFYKKYDSFLNEVRDIGNDGVVRAKGFFPPYASSRSYFGLNNWVYEQYDNPNKFKKLLRAKERQNEKLFQLIVNSPATFISMGSISGNYSPDKFREYCLPFYKKYIPKLHEHDKICSIHAHLSKLDSYKKIINEINIDVIEAFTPPPVGDLSLENARRAWGEDIVIWINFPETLFYKGKKATKEYTEKLLEKEAKFPFIIGFTEMGLYGISDSKTEKLFRQGFLAIMEAIEEKSN